MSATTALITGTLAQVPVYRTTAMGITMTTASMSLEASNDE